MKRNLLGAWGESITADYYRKKGYEICAANFRTRQGEIDLIVKNKTCLVFVEVKTRSENSIDSPGASVTPLKQKRIILAAGQYLSQCQLSDPPVRFDVVEIIKTHSGEFKLNCIENAFVC